MEHRAEWARYIVMSENNGVIKGKLWIVTIVAEKT